MSQFEKIAKVCHEANRAYCESIGDLSQSPWEETGDLRKQSAITGVEFLLATPDVTPEMVHDSWLKTKLSQGYTFGAVKDDCEKKHPCILPYEELPQHEKFKNQMFIAIVKAMI